jgi:flagellar motor switch protein FliM
MSSATLTPEELAAVREQSGPAQNGAASLDLAAGDRSVRRGFGSLSRSLQAFARGGQKQLQQLMKRTARSDEQPLEVVGPTGATEAVEQSAVAVVLKMNGVPAGYLGIDSHLAMALVEKAFGGGSIAPVAAGTAAGDVVAGGAGGASPAPTPTKKRLTRLQMRTVMPFIQDLTGELGKALEAPLIAEAFDSNASLDLPRGLSSFAVYKVELSCQGAAGSVTIVFLPDLVDVATRPKATSLVRDEGRIATHLMDADVELRAVLGGASLTVAELLALRPGDLVRLECGTSDPITVLVQDEPKLTAQPLQRAGGLAVTIERLLP